MPYGVINMPDALYFCNKKENDMNKIFIGFLGVFMLTLSDCGGGSSGTTGAANGAATNGTAIGVVSLSGVVLNGTSVAGVTVGAVAAAKTTINGVFANAMIIAVDKNGNMINTTSDRTGKFTLKLTNNMSYAIIFLDGRTQKLLGSLVQAANTASAGSVALTGNANLGNVVINPATQKAVSENDAKGILVALSVVAAPANLKDANGNVTQSSVKQVTATSLSNGNAAAITQISVTDFSAESNTWASGVSMWTDSYTGESGTDYNLSIFNAVQTQDINGKLVNAVKSSDLTYYSVYKNPNQPTWSRSGYYSYSAAWGFPDYLATAFIAPPATFDYLTGPWTWAGLEYTDAANNQLYSKYDLGNSASSWQKSVPLNITLGQAVTTQQVDPYGTNTNTFTLTLAQEAGATYVFTDTNSVKHPVIRVDAKSVWTPNPTNCQANGGCATQNNNQAFYIVGGYGGVQANVKNPATGVVRTPKMALATVQFGKVVTNPTTGAVSFINVNPLIATMQKLTNAQRDQMLGYAWNGRAQTGIAPTIQGQVATFPSYFYANFDAYGNAASPVSWNPATYMPNYLTAGNLVKLTTRTMNYATGATGVNFNLEFRQYDPATSTSVIIGSPSASVPKAATNQVNTPLTVSGNLTIPTLASLNAANKYSSYLDPATGLPITEGNVELWLVMKDAVNGTVVMEKMLDSYLIH